MIKTLIQTIKIKLIAIAVSFIYLYPSLSSGQSTFFNISSEYDNSAIEWQIVSLDSLDNEILSSVRAKWPNEKSWTEWQFDHLEYFWDMSLRYQTNPQHWYLNTDYGTVAIKQKWRNDFTEWTIRYDDIQLKWTTDFGNDISQWYFEDKEYGFMEMWTSYEGDPRDWEIEDQAPNVPDEMKLAMMLITVILANGGI